MKATMFACELCFLEFWYLPVSIGAEFVLVLGGEEDGSQSQAGGDGLHGEAVPLHRGLIAGIQGFRDSNGLAY